MKRKVIFGSTLILLLASLIFFLSVVDRSENLTVNSTHVDKFRELYVDMLKNGSLIVYPTNLKKQIIEEYKSHLKNMRLFFRGFKMDMIADTAVVDSILKNKSLLVAGTYSSNRLLKKIKNKIPVQLNVDGFYYANHNFNKKKDIAFIAYKNPFNERKISFFLIGNDDDYLLKNMLLRYLSGIQIKSDGENSIIGEFKIDKNNEWFIDKNKFWDFSKSRREYTFDNNKIVFHSDIFTLNDVEIIRNGNNLKTEQLKSFFGDEFKAQGFSFHVFDSFESKGLIIQNTQLSNYDLNSNSIFAVKNNWIDGNDYASLSKLLIEKNIGTAKYNFIGDGFAAFFSKNWRQKGFEYWGAKIYKSKLFPTLAELLDNRNYSYHSDLITNPLGATFIQFYIKKFGKKRTTQLYSSKLSERKIKLLEIDWKKYLDNLYKKYSKQIEEDRLNFTGLTSKFQKGLSYAHEGYRVHNGYLSKSSYESLKKAVELGTNSISIIPFTSTRDPKKPSPFRFWRNAYSENDESIIYLKHLSQELKLNLMLKPHIYFGRGWPGDIEMKNEKDWKLFFKYYKRWISHYAVIAEMYKIPLFCVGNELVKTTITHNDEWVKLIDEIRSIYSGKLTYGANWGEEFEKIKFWDHLDYIGVSEYYPLSKKENPSDIELLDGAKKIISKIAKIQKKYNKPVIFTEVGFRSSQFPWMTSHEKETRKNPNYQNQARSYSAVLKASHGKKWLTGMYWWKWPSYLSDGGDPQNDLYTPHNKHAEEILKQWYSIKWD